MLPPQSYWARALCALTVCALPSYAVQSGSDVDLAALDLEQLLEVEIRDVYGVSRRKQAALDAPSSVSIVTRADIRAQGYRTLGEILAGVTGLYVSYDRNYTYLGVRGFRVPGDFNSRILVMVDGHRLNDTVYGTVGLGFDSPVDPALVERVEVIRGSGSALYGNNAVLAVINVVTRTDVDGLESAAEVASDESYLARVATGGKLSERGDWFMALRGYDSAGADHDYGEFAGTPSGGHTEDTDYESAYQAQTRFAWDEWTVRAAYFWREKGIPTGSYGTVFDDPDNHTVDDAAFFDLAWRPELEPGREVMVRLRYDDYRYRGWYVYDDTASGGPPDMSVRDGYRSRSLALEGQYAFPGWFDDVVTLVLDARSNFDQNQWVRDDVYGETLDDARGSFEVGAFAQDEAKLTEKLTLVTGLRADHYESIGLHLSPWLGCIYRPDAESAFKLVYGGAFRTPNNYEMYYDDGVTQKGNPDLDPEQMHTLEGVWEQVHSEQWRTSLSAFAYEIEDLISLQVDPLDGFFVFENAEHVMAAGLEFEAQATFHSGVRARFSQVVQDVEYESGGEPPDSPDAITQVHLDAPLFSERLRGGVELIWVGPRGTVSGGEVASYLLTNATLRAVEVAPGVEFYLRIHNLFDVDYSDPVGADLTQDALRQDGLKLGLGFSASL